MDSCDVEPTLYVIAVYIFEGLEYGLQFSVGDMVNSCKAYNPGSVRKKGMLLTKNIYAVK